MSSVISYTSVRDALKNMGSRAIKSLPYVFVLALIAGIAIYGATNQDWDWNSLTITDQTKNALIGGAITISVVWVLYVLFGKKDDHSDDPSKYMKKESWFSEGDVEGLP